MDIQSINVVTERNEVEWEHIQKLMTYEAKLRAILKEGSELVNGDTLIAVSQAVETANRHVKNSMAKFNQSANDEGQVISDHPISRDSGAFEPIY